MHEYKLLSFLIWYAVRAHMTHTLLADYTLRS